MWLPTQPRAATVVRWVSDPRQPEPPSGGDVLFSFDSKQPRPRPFADVEAGVAFLQQVADIGGHIFLVLRQQRADTPTPAPAPEL